MIRLFLGLLLFSFILTSLFVVPFINLLYRLKFQRRRQTTRDCLDHSTPIFDKIHSTKVGTPVGGGALIIFSVCFLYLILFSLLRLVQIHFSSNYPIEKELEIIFFTFISFGILGLYDDIHKSFGFGKTKFFGLKLIHKFLLQLFLAFIVSLLIYFRLKINFIYLPFLGVLTLGPLIIPVAIGFIFAFANFFNITDGLDGLSCGLLLISLFAFWVLSASSLDTPISLFLALWIGYLIAFLYFNIFPARIWLGDVGSLSFGATFAVIAILLGKIVPLIIIGSLFIIEGLSSTLQILSKKYFNRKIIPAAPLHLTLQNLGWEEPKIVFRAWLAGIILAVFGLWLGLN